MKPHEAFPNLFVKIRHLILCLLLDHKSEALTTNFTFIAHFYLQLHTLPRLP